MRRAPDLPDHGQHHGRVPRVGPVPVPDQGLVFGPPQTPHISIDTPTGNDDGAMVWVHLTDFPASRAVQLNQCGPQRTAPANPFFVQFVQTCQSGLPAFQPPPQTGPDGSLDVQFQVSRYLVANGQYSVSPNTGLVDGQQVTVSGSGYAVDDCKSGGAACSIAASHPAFRQLSSRRRARSR